MSDSFDDLDIVSPRTMATESYAESHKDEMDAYIMMKVFGQHSSVAFRRVFGEDMWDTYSQARIYAIESTEYYQFNFRAVLNATPITALWNDKISVHELLSMARNVFAKDATRLAAMKELNVIVGVTVIDPNGNTKKGSSMADYYASLQANDEPDNTSDEDTQPAADDTNLQSKQA